MAKLSGARGSGEGDRLVYSEWGVEPSEVEPQRDLAPAQHKLLLRRERKGRGGKTVTVIEGFQLSPDTLATLAKQLKALCGSGGTARSTRIEIQGDHRERVKQALVELGYPVKLMGG